MLGLTLRPDEFIVIGDTVIRGLPHHGGLRLGIAAPDSVAIHRLDRHGRPVNLTRKVISRCGSDAVLSCGHQVELPPMEPDRMDCPKCAAHLEALRPLIEHHFSIESVPSAQSVES